MTIWVFGTSNMAGACNGHLNKITNDYFHEEDVMMTGQLSKLLNEPVINFAKSGIENSEIIYYCKKALDAYNSSPLSSLYIEKPRCAIVEIRGWPDRCTTPLAPTHLKDPDRYREYIELVNEYLTYILNKAKADDKSALTTDNPFMHIEDFIGTKASICGLGTVNKYECLNWPFLQAVNNISMRLMNRDEVKAHKLRNMGKWFHDALSEDDMIKGYLQMSKPNFINDFINWDMFKWEQALHNTDITYGGAPPARGNTTEEIRWLNWQKELYVLKAIFDEHNIPVRFMCWGSAFIKIKKGKEPSIQRLNIFDNMGIVDYFKRQFGERAWEKDLEYCECGHPGPWVCQKLAEYIADIISKEY